MRFFLLLVFVALTNLMQAQQNNTTPTQRCHTDEIHQHNYENDEVYQHNYDIRKVQLDALTAASNLQERAPCVNPIIVPVAIHYEGTTTESAACLEALALSQIAALNADYAASNPDVATYCTVADNTGLDPNALAHDGACIIFCIATLNHPSGFGLNDGDYAITTNQGYNDFSGTWSGYLNFFVRNAGAGILGYSPLFGNGNGDGVTISPCYFGTQGFGCGGFGPDGNCNSAPYDQGRTGTHELGHYLGLNHIWGDGGCGQDDNFTDTPTSGQEYYGCPAEGSNSCGSDDMYMNYMDYVDDACMYMFSEQQATLMNNSASSIWTTSSTKCPTQTYAAPVVPNGCLNVVPVCFVAATSSPTSCVGNDGTATATIANTVGNVTYAWSNGGNTAALTGLAPNTYTVTITDGDGCTSSAMTTVNDDCNCSGLTVTPGVINNISCFGVCDGVGVAQASGGDLIYSYVWSNGFTQQTNNNLCAGTYTITVSDSQGCTGTGLLTMADQPETVVTSSSTAETCLGNDGTASVVASGNNSYIWSNGFPSPTSFGLSSGNYTCTITNNVSGCTTTETVFVGNDCTGCAGLNIGLSLINNVTCAGDCDGSATVLQTTGGNGNYSYSWSSGSNQQVANNLCAGTYMVTVTDTDGCSSVADITIIEPDDINITLSSTPESCIGNNGTAFVTSGASATYTYAWSNGVSGTNASNLAAGTYTLLVTDINTQCFVTETVVVGNSCTGCGGLTVTASVINNASCAGVCDGAATVQAADGNGNYSYAWNNGFNQPTANNLCAGTYTITATDTDGCTGVTTVIITEPAGISAATSSTPENCGAGDGTASVTSVGIATYIYMWNNGTNGTSISNLSAGTYTVTITDINTQCFIVETVIVGDDCGCDGSLSYTTNNITSAGCPGECNGTISGIAVNGTPNYTYTWNNGANTSSLTGLCAGTYTVTIIDASQCVYTESFVITENTGITIQTASTDETCTGNDGTASVTASSANVTFTWSNGFTGSNNTGLSTGNYTVTATDNATGCAATQVVFVDIDCGCNLAITIDSNSASCNGSCDGSASVTSNGNGVTYLWSNGATGSNITNLCAGTYTVTATEGPDCTATGTVIITEPNPLNLSFNNNDAVCGEGTGSVIVNVNGGTTPYTYLWSNGANNNATNGLSAGTYSVTVTDINGCSSSAISTLTSNELLMVTGVMTHPTCMGDMGAIDITVSGGLAPYTYSWNNGLETTEDLTNIPSGNYVIIATDANNCSTGTSFNLAEPQEIFFNMTIINSSDGSNGSIVAGVSGGTSPYDWNWSNGSNSILNNNLAPGDYTVTVTDANGCIGIATATVLNSTGVFDPTLVVDYSVYPNPSTGLFYLSMELLQQEEISVRVINILGQTMLQNQYNSTSIQEEIDIQGLSQGTYFLEIRVKNSRVIEKLMLVK